MHRISGWIFEGNLTKVVEYVAALVNYSWDEHPEGWRFRQVRRERR